MVAATAPGDVVVLPPPARRVESHTLNVTFVGTATLLLRFGGMTILTDPNFLHRGEKVHLGYGLTSTRQTEPALQIDQLPPLDMVLVSHLHEDHFDRVAAQRLRRDVPVLTTLQAAHAMTARMGFEAARGLRTWQAVTFYKGGAGMRLRALPARHAPSLLQAAFPPVNGWLLEFRPPGNETRFRLYITGDTLLVDELRRIARRFPQIDLAVLHLGGTRLFGVKLTMDGRDGAELVQWLRPREALPVHYDDYDVFKSPLADFEQAMQDAHTETAIRPLPPGQSTDFYIPHEVAEMTPAHP
jgi:L-ascorbate metabolism protein UlaG (beta-lactamase superfamily)